MNAFPCHLYYRQTNNNNKKILINSDSEEQHRGGKGSNVNYTSHITTPTFLNFILRFLLGALILSLTFSF